MLQCQPAAQKAPVHQLGLLAVLTHCPPLEGSQGVCMPGQALQDHVPIEDVGGALREGVDQVLVGAGYQLFDDLGLCLGQDAYGIRMLMEVARITARGQGRTWRRCRFLAVAAAVVVAVLISPRCCGWRRWRAVCQRLTPAAQFPAAMASASRGMKP